MTRRHQDIKSIIADVSGFVSYHAVRTADGLVPVTICQTQAGTEDTTRRAAAWIKENLPSASIAPTEVISGEVFLEFSSQGVRSSSRHRLPAAASTMGDAVNHIGWPDKEIEI